MNIKTIVALLFFVASQLQALSSTMNHRLITSSPLLYKQINYVDHTLSIEFEPLYSHSFDPENIMANLSLDGRSTVSLNQQGNGDINSAWLYLGSANSDMNYASTVTFNPTQQLYGGLFHCYKEFEYFFFDIKTSLLGCKNQISLTEVGGGNGGGIATSDNQIIYNAYEAFTQNDYQFGKIGASQTLIGFDNIQLMFGGAGDVTTMQGQNVQSYVAGFAVIEVPTGAGTTSQWLFEPQIGTNHWGLGFGVDAMFVSDGGWSCVVGGNFRHLIANWETRTFDLTENGAWSRYLLVESQESFDSAMHVGVPAINILTQPALIEGRNQITAYARLEKTFDTCLFEVSYNLFYNQAESITRVTPIPTNYGIYNISNSGGVNTASTAKINQADLGTGDLSGFVPLQTADLNLNSGAQGQWLSNTVAVRVQKLQEFYTYGIGASIDLARGNQAISSWAAWLNFEVLLP